MKARYFEDTDTLYLELRATEVVETRDLDDETVLDYDAQGNIVSLTQSLSYHFGAGVVVPGTGILLNNSLSNFSVAPSTAVKPSNRSASHSRS